VDSIGHERRGTTPGLETAGDHLRDLSERGGFDTIRNRDEAAQMGCAGAPFLGEAGRMIDPRVASGLRDVPPAAALPRERMLARFREVFGSFGYVPIETPHIERMEVLTGKGAGSDEVLRQIFEVTNKGGTPGELALRFDLTVPLARFIAKHVDTLGVPFKRYAIGSVFRGERPAKGRFREFTQCDFDTVGTESVVADAETIAVTAAALGPFVEGFRIAINNRKVLDGVIESIGIAPAAKATVLRGLDKLAKEGRERVCEFLTGAKAESGDTDSTAEESGAATCALSKEQAARLLDFAATGKGTIEEVIRRIEKEYDTNSQMSTGLSELRGVGELLRFGSLGTSVIEADLGLSRGLDYYTGTIFETTVTGWERYGSIASGGRYDNLASLYTSRKLPGVGGSIGLDRLLALLEESGRLTTTGSTASVLVAWFPGVAAAVPVRLGARLREAGVAAEVFPDAIQVGKQMQYGVSRGHKLAVIVGPDEESREVANLRDLATRQEEKGVPWAELPSRTRNRLGLGSP
jgi:histidyl-tRNA synthetase